jgi:hypothetical protein
MGGALLQLVAYGAQDIYLTGNPQFTYFKLVYKRHTNFAMETIEQSYSNTADFTKEIQIEIGRFGDLLGRTWLELQVSGLGENGYYKGRFGYKLIEWAELWIGGQVIDKQYGRWMDIWSQLTTPIEKYDNLISMLDGWTCITPPNIITPTDDLRLVYIPLQFWFCRNPGLFLPLVALQYHEVVIKIQFNSDYFFPGVSIEKLNVLSDYVFIDTDERRRFAQVSHEYLIEQVQHLTPFSINSVNRVNIPLRFNHPVKYIVWALKRAQGTTPYDFNYWPFNDMGPTSTRQYDLMEKAKIQLNGLDRFKFRPGAYFREYQPYQYFTNYSINSGNEFGGFYVYSFGLNPEDTQPSGTLNFSRIDNAVLFMDLNNYPLNGTPFGTYNQNSYNLFTYAVNYNILRIMSGMAGLAYSN